MKSEIEVVQELNKYLPDSVHEQGLLWSLCDTGYLCTISFGNQVMWDPELSTIERPDGKDTTYYDIFEYCIKQLRDYIKDLNRVLLDLPTQIEHDI